MRGYHFKTTIAGFDFWFEKLTLKNNEQLFFVSSNIQDERSFFMSKSTEGSWMILYHNILGKEVLLLEHDLSEAIREQGY